MATVWLPSLWQDLSNGVGQVVVPGATVGQVVEALATRYAGLRERLCARDGALRAGIAVAVDGDVVAGGLDAPVTDANEIHFIPAIGGG